MLDRIYRSAAEYLFSSVSGGTVFRFHRSFRDGHLYDWIYHSDSTQVHVVRYAFDGVCPERFDFCAATLVQAFAGELLRPQKAEGWSDRYVFCASLLARPVTEVGPQLTD